MTLEIRPERKDEYEAVEELTREAFWNLHVPGASEHFLLHNLRNSEAFIDELDFVAIKDGKLAGSIVYSRSLIEDASGAAHEVITFGPLSVLPAMQGQGIGSALIRHSQKRAAEMGHKATVICGHPAYYARFGFVCGKEYGICAADGRYLKALLAREHFVGALRGVSGKLFEDPAFACDEAALAAFDARFAPREKAVTETQKEFAVLSNTLA